jgi:uncharacterized protein YqgC (DUF456 family)
MFTLKLLIAPAIPAASMVRFGIIVYKTSTSGMTKENNHKPH